MSAEHAVSHNEIQARAAVRSLPLAADPARVGRTHRVVRERAQVMRESRQQRRSLWLPLTIASAMMIMLFYAVWSGFVQYDVAEISDEVAGSLRGGSQMLILGLWFLPVTVTALFFVWIQRNRNRNDDSY
jgi:hypothetical protein